MHFALRKSSCLISNWDLREEIIISKQASHSHICFQGKTGRDCRWWSLNKKVRRRKCLQSQASSGLPDKGHQTPGWTPEKNNISGQHMPAKAQMISNTVGFRQDTNWFSIQRKIKYLNFITSQTVAWTLSALHAPCENLPHSPSGVPKLANSIEVIFHPRSHTNLASDAIFSDVDNIDFHSPTRGGSDSPTLMHTAWLVLVTTVIFVGSPPSSSWRINRLSPDCTQERGRWYLNYNN